MRPLQLSFLLLLSLFPLLLPAQRLEYEALFLGNSYTYQNNLPLILRQLAMAGGDTLIHDQNTPGGYTLEGHSTNATSINKINARNWDFVVLQEQSQLPSFPPSQVASQVYPYAAALDSMITAHDSCTETVFYMTWGRKHGDASNCGFYPPVCTYAGMQARLRSSYLQMAQDNEALVAPCGVAWWECILRDSTLELYSPDESHPAYAGSYLNACVFYATLYRKDPLGLEFYGSLDSTTATFLQEVARDVVFDSLEQWRIGLADVVAGFGYSVSPNGQVSFADSSANAGSWHWDFGDGAQDSVPNPVHQFLSSGSYNVQLIVGNGCMWDTVVQTIQVVLVGMEEEEDIPVIIAPNPGDGLFQLKVQQIAQEELSVNVFDTKGKLVWSREVRSPGTVDIDLRGRAAGVYLLQLSGEGREKAIRRLVIRP